MRFLAGLLPAPGSLTVSNGTFTSVSAWLLESLLFFPGFTESTVCAFDSFPLLSLAGGVAIAKKDSCSFLLSLSGGRGVSREDSLLCWS